MTEDKLPTTSSNPESPLTRRRMLAAAGTGALMLLVVPRAFGHDDHADDDHDDDDDSGRGRGRGRGGDDDAVQPAGEVPAGSVEVQIVDDDANGFQPGTVGDVGQPG